PKIEFTLIITGFCPMRRDGYHCLGYFCPSRVQLNDDDCPDNACHSEHLYWGKSFLENKHPNQCCDDWLHRRQNRGFRCFSLVQSVCIYDIGKCGRQKSETNCKK